MSSSETPVSKSAPADAPTAAPGPGSPGGGSDDVLVALGEMAAALQQNAEDERLLAGRIEELRRARMAGASWHDVLRAEPDPGTLQLVSRVHARISERSGTLRRAVVAVLREEGASIPSIAQLFGVTHQRISNLIRRTGR